MAVALAPIGTQGGQIWQDNVYPWKVYGGMGQGIRAWALPATLECDISTSTPAAFIMTTTGTTPTFAVGVLQGYPAILTTTATAYDGLNVQMRGSVCKTVANKQFYVRGILKASELTTSDLLFGVAALKTDLMKTSSAHGVNTSVEGCFFSKASGSAAMTFYTYVAGTLTNSIAVGNLTVADIDYAIWWDGTYVRAYLNNVLVAQFSTSLPTVTMTPSINWRTGASAAITLSISELAYVSVE